MTATIARRTVRAGIKVLALLLSVVLPLLLVVVVLPLPVLGSIVLQLFVVHPIWSTMPLTPPTSDSSCISAQLASTVQQPRAQLAKSTPSTLPDTTVTKHPTASVPHAVPLPVPSIHSESSIPVALVHWTQEVTLSALLPWTPSNSRVNASRKVFMLTVSA